MQTHKHQCPTCKYVWQHPDSVCDTNEDCVRSHVCPNCGRYDKSASPAPSTRDYYKGPKKPDAVFNGPHGKPLANPYRNIKGVQP